MKKVFFVLAVCAVVSAALVGCGSSSSTEGSDSAATSTAAVSSSAENSAEEVSTVAIGETATIGGWEITVTSVEYAPELTPVTVVQTYDFCQRRQSVCYCKCTD